MPTSSMKPQWTAFTASRPHLVSVARCAACTRHNIQQRAISNAVRYLSTYSSTVEPRSTRTCNILRRNQLHYKKQGAFNANQATCITRYSSTIASASAIEQHAQTVEAISAAVRGYYERKEKFRIYHGSTNSTRSGRKKNLLDTSKLKNVINVDVQAKTCLVEPGVSQDRLVVATMKYGLVPKVVPEFPGISTFILFSNPAPLGVDP
jgi:hypothetical protein